MTAFPTPPEPSSWARSLLAAVGDAPVPAYGSPEFDALPVDSPLRVAATVAAAESYRGLTDPAYLAWRLQVELDAARQHAADEAVHDDIEAGARAAMARDVVIAAGCRDLAEAGAAQLLGRRPTALQLAVRRDELPHAVRLLDQRERIDAEFPLRRPVGLPSTSAMIRAVS